MWTYFKLTYANGDWSLFRENGQHEQQRYNRRDGWLPTDDLDEKRVEGEIGEDDIISEQDAQALIAALPPQPM